MAFSDWWSTGTAGIQPNAISAIRDRRAMTTGTGAGVGGGGALSKPIQALGGGATPEQVIQLANEINQRSQQQANAGRIPQGAELEALSSGNINRALSGQLDESVINQLAQRQAERGAQMGIASGSPSNNAAYLKALGLNSLDLMNTGQGWLTQAVGRNPAAPIWNAGNMVLTPEQQAQIDIQNRTLSEQIRANEAREAIAWDEARRRNGSGNQPYLSGSFGVGSGGGGGGFTGKPPYTETDPRFKPQLPDVFAPSTGSTGSGTGQRSIGSNWADDPFDWAWNGSTAPASDADWEDAMFW